MNEGRGFINYAGHGSTQSWAGPEVTADDVRSLDNPDALPVVIANACVTGHFTANSFAEVWLKHPHGAVMYWGSMDSTYWDEDDVLQRALYDVIFKNGEHNVSDFTDAALEAVWRYYGGEGKSHYYWETYVTFGDPSMEWRDQAPTKVALKAWKLRGSKLSTAVVDASGHPVVGARVALVNDKTQFVGRSDADSAVSFDVSGVTSASLWRVSVSGANVKLLETPLSSLESYR